MTNATPKTIAREFPSDFFPPAVEAFRQSAARSIGIADEYLAGPMLAATSVAIGTAMGATVKPGWDEPASLFVATVGFSSSGKTPAGKHALKPLVHRHRTPAGDGLATPTASEAGHDHLCVGSHPGDETDFACECDEGAEGYSPPRGPRSGENEEPVSQLIVKDTTLAALWEILERNPRGVLVYVDELAAMFTQSTPAQRQTWCEVYQADSRTVHRSSKSRRSIVLPRTFVSLAGGIQPDFFPSIRGKYDGGLLERFLICGRPEGSLPPWSDEVVDPAAEEAWNLSLVALLDIDKAAYTGPEEHRDRLAFTPAAYERLRSLRGSLEAHLQSQGVHVRHHGVVLKLIANAARLSLIRRCLRWSSGEFGLFGPVGQIEEADADAACRAAEFFLTRYLLWRPELLNTATAAGAAPTAPPMTLTDRLLAYLASKERAEVPVRWLRQQTLEGNPSTAEIRAALDEAVARGQGRWQDEKKQVYVRD